MGIVPRPLEETFPPVMKTISSDAHNSSSMKPSLAGMLEGVLQTLK